MPHTKKTDFLMYSFIYAVHSIVIPFVCFSDHRCSRTYSPREDKEELGRICQDDVCRCTQGKVWMCLHQNIIAWVCTHVAGHLNVYWLNISRWLLHLQNWNGKLPQQRKRDICLQRLTPRYDKHSHNHCSRMHAHIFMIIEIQNKYTHT